MINDIWPSPAADSVTGPHLKVKCRNDKPCLEDTMDFTNNCYDTLAFVDRYGSYHHGMPDNAVAPQEYSNTYVPYGRYSRTTLTLMVRNNQLRAVFTPGEGQKVVGVMDFDLENHYTPGEVGLFVFADQAVFSDLSVTPINEVKKFCNGGRCMPNGLCEDMEIATAVGGGSSHSSSSPDDDTGDGGALVGTIIGLLIFAFCVGFGGYYYGSNYGYYGGGTSAKYSTDIQMNAPQSFGGGNPLRSTPGGAVKDSSYDMLSNQ